jgi:phosphatidylglycerophosphatase A
MKYFHLAIATVCGAGYFPVASGTFGTLVAVVPYYVLRENPLLYVIVTLLCIGVGVWSSSVVETIFQEKDSGKIVIDEVAGYFVTMAFLPQHWFYPLAGFVLFRLFDVWKPFGIRQTQKLKGGWGVMIDDVLAGILANAILQVINLLYKF